MSYNIIFIFFYTEINNYLTFLYDYYYFRYLNFFSKNLTYVITEKSNWNLDDGYPQYLKNNILLNIYPIRTSGVSYYHRLKVILHTMDDEFIGCPNLNFSKGNFIVSIYLNTMLYILYIMCILTIVHGSFPENKLKFFKI